MVPGRKIKKDRESCYGVKSLDLSRKRCRKTGLKKGEWDRNLMTIGGVGKFGGRAGLTFSPQVNVGKV